MEKAGVAPADLLWRHGSSDWGDMPAEDATENDRSVRLGVRVLSSYPLPGTNARIWLLTNWTDTVMYALPEKQIDARSFPHQL